MSNLSIEGICTGPFSTNAYIVADVDTKKCAIVDPAWDADQVWGPVLEDNGLQLEKILLTHGHIDHVSGVAALTRAYPGTPVLIHELDEPMLHESNSQSAKMFGLPFEPSEATDYLEEGEPVKVGGVSFDVLFVPGHCPGHVALLHDKHLLAGDVLFHQSIGRTDLPGGNYNELADSIVNKLMTLDDDVVVYPGHGPVTTIGQERLTNPFVREMLAERGKV